MKTKAKNKTKEEIIHLFSEAQKVFNKNRSLSNRYVLMALKLSMKNKVSISKELKRNYCKKCKSYLKQPYNLCVRITNSKAVYTCKNCNYHMRFSLK